MSVSMCDSLGDERLPADAGEVDHCKELSDDIGGLALNEDYNDVTFIVGGKTFSAHRVILAARCQYFRALLFGGMRESQPQAEITVDDTTPEAFQMLLQYIYTGKLKLSELTEECMLEILALSNKYGFSSLETSISNFLLRTISIVNACEIYEVATLYSLMELKEAAVEFIDRNALDVLNSDAFLSLSLDAVTKLIKRDSFCASEKAIFKAAKAWLDQNIDQMPATSLEERQRCDQSQRQLLSSVRLPLMSEQELFHVVRPSGLVSADALLDAIQKKSEHTNIELNYRGVLCPEENIATMQHGAQVVKGEMCTALLDGDSQNYDLERGFTRHSIDDAAVGSKQEAGIVVKLGRPSIINHIRMLLWDRDVRAYSYYIEVSMDDKDWVKVVDYSRCHCRAWQFLYFHRRVVRYIRIVGTNNTVNKVFHLVTMEAMFTKKTEIIEDGIVVPQANIATTAKSAIVIEGVSRDRNALLNGDFGNYDWDSGYTCHQLGNGGIIVQLNQPYQISSMRMLLWDIDERSYGYYIEASLDQKNWDRIVDNTKEECRSWQSLSFSRRPVVYVRVVGTNNTANEVFHCVHFECPDSSLPVQAQETNEEPRREAHCGEMHAGCAYNSDGEVIDVNEAGSLSLQPPHRGSFEDGGKSQIEQDENEPGEGRRTMRHSR